MTDDEKPLSGAEAGSDAALPAAARRALAEAAERRRQQGDANGPPETGGRDGPDPVRYGDWERNGIISDF